MNPVNPKSIKEVLEKIEQDKKNVEFLSTGFYNLDKWLDGGFLRKELIVIGANSGWGKSYLASQLMYNIAKFGFKCAYFSLEISNEMIVSRMLGALSNIKPTRISYGLLTEEEQEKKIKAKAELEMIGNNIFFYDDTYELDQILAEIITRKYEFIIVDFVQNVVTNEKDEYLRLSKVSLELQRMAKKVDGTVLALSQLSNAVAREGIKGKTIEYKGSGGIATACDLGFFIQRTDTDWNSFTDNPFTLVLAKNRRGGGNKEFNLFFKSPGGFIYEP